ncbi:hypothetical protein ACTFIZ_009471 [Dictyostelium cf. discoideum]
MVKACDIKGSSSLCKCQDIFGGSPCIEVIRRVDQRANVQEVINSILKLQIYKDNLNHPRYLDLKYCRVIDCPNEAIHGAHVFHIGRIGLIRTCATCNPSSSDTCNDLKVYTLWYDIHDYCIKKN